MAAKEVIFGDSARAIGDTVDGVVVLHDEHAVLGEQHVHVEHVDPGLHALAEVGSEHGGVGHLLADP